MTDAVDRHAVHFTSARTGTGRDDWRTPRGLFGSLDDEFRFDLDAAASPENALCRNFMTADGRYRDGELVVSGCSALSENRSWEGRVAFLNPPYSLLRRFLMRALGESGRGVTTVALVPARTDTKAWHEAAMLASEIRLVKGRISFLGADGEPMRDKNGRPVGAPFPSAIVVFRPGHEGPPKLTTMSARSLVRTVREEA